MTTLTSWRILFQIQINFVFYCIYWRWPIWHLWKIWHILYFVHRLTSPPFFTDAGTSKMLCCISGHMSWGVWLQLKFNVRPFHSHFMTSPKVLCSSWRNDWVVQVWLILATFTSFQNASLQSCQSPNLKLGAVSRVQLGVISNKTLFASVFKMVSHLRLKSYIFLTQWMK